MEAFDDFYDNLVQSITADVEKKILNKIQIQQNLDKPLTPDEVAKFLKVDKTTVYKLCKEGQIKSVKIGSIHSRKPHLRIFKKDLKEYLNSKEGE